MDQAENKYVDLIYRPSISHAAFSEQILTMLNPSAIDYVTTSRPLLSPTPPRPQLPYTQLHTAHMQAQPSNYSVQSYQSGQYWPANHSNYGQTTVAPVSTLSPLRAQSSQSPVVNQIPTADAQLAHARPAKVSHISSLEGALGKEVNQSAKVLLGKKKSFLSHSSRQLKMSLTRSTLSRR